jgi:cytochrome c oxidase assembly protein subunit 15
VLEMGMSKRFSTWTSKLILFNGLLALFIILWGAWVRLSGSGAGCGDHWPLCHGQVIPLSPSIKTIIELTHRLTSGIFGLTVLGQWYFSYKEYGKKHPQFWASMAFLIVTIIEALIGAVLVKKGLVVDNSSALRAWVIGAHLVNTLLLLGVLALCYSFLHIPMGLVRREVKTLEKYLASIGLTLFLVVGAFGAIAALGNTLFPSEDLIQGLASDFDPQAPFLIRLRVYHPMMAVMLGVLWIGLLVTWREKPELGNLAQISLGLLFIALGFGVINWLLMAPVWGALIHLLLGDLLWMSVCTTSIHRFFLIPKNNA